jgi:hypothetical protein
MKEPKVSCTGTSPSSIGGTHRTKIGRGGYKINLYNRLEESSLPIQPKGSVTDLDITPLDAPVADPPTVMQGPMTRAQMHQLHLEVSSFLSDSFHTFENRLLPNDVLLPRNNGEGREENNHEELGTMKNLE